MSVSSPVFESSFKAIFRSIWNELTDALSDMSRWERGCHVLWLLGPFILLIERSPADVWVSVLALAFVVRASLKRHGAWLHVFWVRTCFLFLGVCLLSSVMSVMPLYAFSESLAWFRFPLFAMATVFWLGTDKRLLHAMLVSTAIGMLLMTGILTAELILEGQKEGRLTWPYNDHVPGNYLSKVGLPAFTVMVALVIGAKPRLSSIMGGLSFITILISLLTGERMNFLLTACSGMLAAVAWRRNWRRYIILIVINLVALFAVFSTMPILQEKFYNAAVIHLPTGPQSDYYRVMGAGLAVFETAPVFGIGPATHRDLCLGIVGEYVLHSGGFRCNNHPHNFYVQFLAETGVIGLIAGSLMIMSIIWAAFVGWRKNQNNVVAATAFIAPLGLFFPFQSTGDFFGQWNNIFLWSAVAIALAAARTLVSNQPNKN